MGVWSKVECRSVITNIIVEGGVYSGLGFCYFVGSTISLMLALLSVVEVYYLVWEVFLVQWLLSVLYRQV